MWAVISTLLASDSEGNRLEPIWGPDAHGGSNWDRPGNEWGAGFVFPHAGCWEIQAASGSNTGRMWLDVIESDASPAATPVATPDTAIQLYPIPPSCSVTPLSAPQEGHWGYVARWWTGTGLTATAPSDPLYQKVGYDFRWELQARNAADAERSPPGSAGSIVRALDRSQSESQSGLPDRDRFSQSPAAGRCTPRRASSRSTSLSTSTRMAVSRPTVVHRDRPPTASRQSPERLGPESDLTTGRNVLIWK